MIILSPRNSLELQPQNKFKYGWTTLDLLNKY